MFLLLVVFLIPGIFSATEASDINQQPIDNRTLCPYCVQFINTQLKPILDIPNIWQVAYFKLVPYGNSDVKKFGMNYNFTCQYGQAECQGNIIQNCALNLYDVRTKAMPFILCLEGSIKNWNVDGPTCAQKVGVNYTEIKSCTNSLYGRHWQYQAALQTEFINVDHVPYVVVNGVFNATKQKEILSNLLSIICKSYTGNIKLSQCSK